MFQASTALADLNHYTPGPGDPPKDPCPEDPKDPDT